MLDEAMTLLKEGERICTKWGHLRGMIENFGMQANILHAFVEELQSSLGSPD